MRKIVCYETISRDRPSSGFFGKSDSCEKKECAVSLIKN